MSVNAPSGTDGRIRHGPAGPCQVLCTLKLFGTASIGHSVSQPALPIHPIISAQDKAAEAILLLTGHNHRPSEDCVLFGEQ